jgi:hypothetical protein
MHCQFISCVNYCSLVFFSNSPPFNLSPAPPLPEYIAHSNSSGMVGQGTMPCGMVSAMLQDVSASTIWMRFWWAEVFSSCGSRSWRAFGTWIDMDWIIGHHPCLSGVARKRHKDHMLVPSGCQVGNMKCEGHAHLASSCAVRYISIGPF